MALTKTKEAELGNPGTYHCGGQQGLVVEQNPSGCYLLQPLLAGIPAALLILPIVVVSVVESSQQLLRESANCSHEGLAENGISSQLQRRVCQGEKGKRHNEVKRILPFMHR